MGFERKDMDITGVDGRLHALVVDDLFAKKGSLILDALCNRAAVLLREKSPTNNSEVKSCEDKSKYIFIKEVLPFMSIRSNGTINSDNARSVIKSVIKNKLANMRRSVGGKKQVTTFSVPEVIAYCEMLGLNPESVLVDPKTLGFFLPVQHCTIEEVVEWLREARRKVGIHGIVHIPFYSAPLLGVNLDLFVNIDGGLGEKKDLDERIFFHSYSLPETKQACQGKGGDKNIVKVVAHLTCRECGIGKRFDFGKCRDSIEEGPNGLRNYLKTAIKMFYKVCQEHYQNNKSNLKELKKVASGAAIAQYYSNEFEAMFDLWIKSGPKGEGVGKEIPGTNLSDPLLCMSRN